MICPSCHMDDEHVVNSRETRDGQEVRRRRACLACGHRWTTREVAARRLQSPLPPVKRARHDSTEDA